MQRRWSWNIRYVHHDWTILQCSRLARQLDIQPELDIDANDISSQDD
jgi:hypothetical protein